MSPSVSTISVAPVSAVQLTQNASTITVALIASTVPVMSIVLTMPVISIASTESVTPIESFSLVTFKPIVSDFNDLSAELSSPIASTKSNIMAFTVPITPIAFDPIASDDDSLSNFSEKSIDNKSSDDENHIYDDPDLDEVIMHSSLVPIEGKI